MKKTNIAKLKWGKWKSPKGKFTQSYKNISGAVAVDYFDGEE